MAAAREEAEMVLFDSVRNVLEEAKLKPGQVGLHSHVSVGKSPDPELSYVMWGLHVRPCLSFACNVAAN